MGERWSILAPGERALAGVQQLHGLASRHMGAPPFPEPMVRLRRFVVCLALLGVACSHSPPPAAPELPPARPAPQSPYYDVPAMSTFSVALVNAVGTRLSAPGDAFRAKVISPLRTLRGDTLVPVGSVLNGRIVTVAQAPASRIRLKFETLTTARGTVPLYATLTDAQPDPSFIVQPQRDLDRSDYDATLDGVPALPMGRESIQVRSHSDIRLPPRTQLQIVLTHPLRIRR